LDISTGWIAKIVKILDMANQNNTNNHSASTPAAVSEAQEDLKNFWSSVTNEIKELTPNDLRVQELPLARIKKIMKLDEDVKMISAEAPVLFAKAAEVFIHELTLRAWIHTEDNKRRTLQRNDIAMAISKYDQFDFLIDIVPRDELKPVKKEDSKSHSIVGTEQVQYYLQLAQQQHAALQQTTTGGVQILQGGLGGGMQTIQLIQQPGGGTQAVMQQPQIITQQGGVLQLGTQYHHPQVQSQATATAGGGLQLVQQVIGPNGEVQNVPIQLSASQLQMLRMQIQQNNTQATQSQPIILTSGTTGQAGAQIINS
jgi:nuclear transcription factor Y gamma